MIKLANEHTTATMQQKEKEANSLCTIKNFVNRKFRADQKRSDIFT